MNKKKSMNTLNSTFNSRLNKLDLDILILPLP